MRSDLPGARIAELVGTDAGSFRKADHPLDLPKNGYSGRSL